MAGASDDLGDEASRGRTLSAGAPQVAEDGSDLVWTRHIGGSTLRTRQRASGSRLVERSGLGRISFDLAVEDGSLLYRQSSIHVLGLPVPSSLSPRVEAVVSATAEGWHGFEMSACRR